MISPDISTGITLLLYSVAVATGMTGMLVRSPLWRRTGCGITIAGFLCQTLVLISGFHTSVPGGLSAGAYLQLVAWFVILCGIVAVIKLRHSPPLLFATPLGLMLFLLSTPYLGTAIRVPPSLSTSFYTLHVGALFLSLALLALAFGSGVIFLYLEKQIKRKRAVTGFWQDMPALARLDKINALATTIGYPLYTVGILSGFFWAKPVFGGVITGDPKEYLSIAIWLLFSILFHNRLAKGWKGRKPALFAVLIFALSLFSITVVNTFLETHHAFTRG